jgi:hypothetical protein
MSDELTVKVARAIFEANSGPFSENGLSPEGLDALYREARAAIAAIDEARGWRPIESAPRNGLGGAKGPTIDLGVTVRGHPGFRRIPDCYWKDGKWHSRWRDGAGDSALILAANITHWHPLPAPPKSSLSPITYPPSALNSAAGTKGRTSI